jgi:hypothetical protein
MVRHCHIVCDNLRNLLTALELGGLDQPALASVAAPPDIPPYAPAGAVRRRGSLVISTGGRGRHRFLELKGFPSLSAQPLLP